MWHEYFLHPIWMCALMKVEKNLRFLHPLRFSRYFVWMGLISRKKNKGMEREKWSRNMLRCWRDRGRGWRGGRGDWSRDRSENGWRGGQPGRGWFWCWSSGRDIVWEEWPGEGLSASRGEQGTRPAQLRRPGLHGPRAGSWSAGLLVRSQDSPPRNIVEWLSGLGPKYRRRQWDVVSDDFLCCSLIPGGPRLPTQ